MDGKTFLFALLLDVFILSINQLQKSPFLVVKVRAPIRLMVADALSITNISGSIAGNLNTMVFRED